MVFAIILAAVEVLITFASSKWFSSQLYTVSAVAGVVAIVMVRWKYFAAVHALVGALALCIASGANAHQYMIYCIGNLFGLAALLMVRFLGEKKIRKNPIFSVLYGVVTLFLMQTGRGLMALILGYGFKNAIAFFATDSLSYVFVAVIMLVARSQDGLLEEQVSYIRRIQEAEEHKS